MAIPDRPPAPLKVSRVFAASRETVFDAWSTAQHVRAWFSPAHFTCPDAKVEMRVGGPFEVCMRAPDGSEHWTLGRVAEIDPGRRLVLDLHVPDGEGGVLFHAWTEVEFIDVANGTRMDVTQTYSFTDPSVAGEMVKGAPEGWSQTLDKLEAEVRRIT